MSGRVYKLPIDRGILLTTQAQNLWVITAGTSAPFLLEEIRIDPNATSVSELSIQVSQYTTFTAASGGTSGTPYPANRGDAAALLSYQYIPTTSLTATNTTTGSTGVGLRVMDAGAFNTVNGWSWQPIDPDHRISCPAGGAIAVTIATTTTLGTTISGCVTVREMF